MNNRVLFIILFGIAFLLIGIIIFFSLTRKSQDERTVLPTPTPVQQQDALPQRGHLQTTPSPAPLTLVNIDPVEDATGEKNYAPGKHVVFTFNKDVSPASVLVEVTPRVELDLQFGSSPKQVVVFPEFGWTADTLYTITIKKGTTAIDGGVLQQDIIYRIKTTLNQGGV